MKQLSALPLCNWALNGDLLLRHTEFTGTHGFGILVTLPEEREWLSVIVAERMVRKRNKNDNHRKLRLKVLVYIF